MSRNQREGWYGGKFFGHHTRGKISSNGRTLSLRLISKLRRRVSFATWVSRG